MFDLSKKDKKYNDLLLINVASKIIEEKKYKKEIDNDTVKRDFNEIVKKENNIDLFLSLSNFKYLKKEIIDIIHTKDSLSFIRNYINNYNLKRGVFEC